MKLSTNVWDQDGNSWHIEIDFEVYHSSLEWLRENGFTHVRPVPAGSKVAEDIARLNELLEVPEGGSVKRNDFPAIGYTKHLLKGGGYRVSLWGEFGNFPQTSSLYSESRVPGIKVVGDHGDLFANGIIHKMSATSRSEWEDEIILFTQPMEFYIAPDVDKAGNWKTTDKGQAQWRFVQFVDFDYGSVDVKPWAEWHTAAQFQAWCESNGADWEYAYDLLKEQADAYRKNVGGDPTLPQLAEGLYAVLTAKGE